MPPIGRLVQLPPIVQIAKHEFSFAEKPLITPPSGGAVRVVDAAGKETKTDTDNGVLYYPQLDAGVHTSILLVTNTDLDVSSVNDKSDSPPSEHGSKVIGDVPSELPRGDFKPIATLYKNKVDFEEELLKLGDELW